MTYGLYFTDTNSRKIDSWDLVNLLHQQLAVHLTLVCLIIAEKKLEKGRMVINEGSSTQIKKMKKRILTSLEVVVLLRKWRHPHQILDGDSEIAGAGRIRSTDCSPSESFV